MPYPRSAVRLSGILFWTALTIAVAEQMSVRVPAHAMEPEAQGSVVDQDVITSTRPIEELAKLMERRYASPVTYEDPV
jgi:hypothetical protein